MNRASDEASLQANSNGGAKANPRTAPAFARRPHGSARTPSFGVDPDEHGDGAGRRASCASTRAIEVRCLGHIQCLDWFMVVRPLRCSVFGAAAFVLAACGSESTEPPSPLGGPEGAELLVEQDDLGEDDPYFIDEETGAAIELPDG